MKPRHPTQPPPSPKLCKKIEQDQTGNNTDKNRISQRERRIKGRKKVDANTGEENSRRKYLCFEEEKPKKIERKSTLTASLAECTCANMTKYDHRSCC
jgi:hypothetical protein